MSLCNCQTSLPLTSMASSKEEESQIDSHYYGVNNFDQDETIPTSDGIEEPHSFTSVVEESQFVDIELETQPEDEFDASQTTQMVMESIEPIISSAKHASVAVPVIPPAQALLVERPVGNIPNSPTEFKFALALKANNVNSGRPKSNISLMNMRQDPQLDTLESPIQAQSSSSPGK
jgi:hypothetical protein